VCTITGLAITVAGPTAMREPRDEIGRAGDQMMSQHEVYQAVIDAALRENVEQARSTAS
jgi:hypothetical protein